MVDSFQNTSPARAKVDEDLGTVDFRSYDRRRLSYATTFEDPRKSALIRVIEALTGKLTVLRLIKEFERQGAPRGQKFWRAALDVMGIDLTMAWRSTASWFFLSRYSSSCSPSKQTAR